MQKFLSLCKTSVHKNEIVIFLVLFVVSSSIVTFDYLVWTTSSERIKWKSMALFSGDEPFYLEIASSIARFHSLAVDHVFINSEKDPYLELPPMYYNTNSCRLHHTLRASDDHCYSQDNGLPLILALGYYLGGAIGSMLTMSLLFSIQGIVFYKISNHFTTKNLSFFLAILVSVATMLLSFSPRIYPDFPAGALLLTAFYFFFFRRNNFANVSITGFLLGFLPFLKPPFLMFIIILLPIMIIILFKRHLYNNLLHLTISFAIVILIYLSLLIATAPIEYTPGLGGVYIKFIRDFFTPPSPNTVLYTLVASNGATKQFSMNYADYNTFKVELPPSAKIINPTQIYTSTPPDSIESAYSWLSIKHPSSVLPLTTSQLTSSGPPSSSQSNFTLFSTMIQGTERYLLGQDYGLLIYSPLALLSIFGMKYIWKYDKFLPISIILPTFVLVEALSLTGLDSGGWSMPGRYVIPVLPILLIPLFPLFEKFNKNIIFHLIILFCSYVGVSLNIIFARTIYGHILPDIRSDALSNVTFGLTRDFPHIVYDYSLPPPSAIISSGPVFLIFIIILSSCFVFFTFSTTVKKILKVKTRKIVFFILVAAIYGSIFYFSYDIISKYYIQSEIYSIFDETLKRKPTNSELIHWENAISNNIITFDEMRNLLANSDEGKITTKISQLYEEILKREPDVLGLQDWKEKILNKEININDLENFIKNSPEALKLKNEK